MTRAIALPRALISLARPLGIAAAALAVALASFALVAVAPTESPVRALLPGVAVVIAGVLLFSSRYERSLLFFVLYIGLLDGYLKLSTGLENVTLLRDVVLYSVVAGAAIRLIVRRDRLDIPPMTGFVVVWVVIVVIQVFNPNGALLHGIQSTRQHLEFVPLFFFGYAIMRTNGRLLGLLIAAVLIGAANGLVNLIQFGLTPEQFASWGPGYADLINGTGGVAGRTFLDASVGKAFVRPFGLGGDFGFGGIACLFALPAAITLIILGRHRKLGLAVALPGLAFIVVGLVTSQLRTAVLGAIISLIAFAGLTILSRKAVVSLLAIAFVGAGAYGLVSTFAANNERSGLARYESIAPKKVVGTAIQDRGGSVAEAPQFAVNNPLGVGLGTLGPAASLGGGAQDTGANSENEFSFLLAEVGIPGLLVLFGLLCTLLTHSVRVVRACVDPIERMTLAALCAPLFFIAVSWFTGTSTTASYSASYFWFIAGILAWRVAQKRAERTTLDG